MITKAIKQGLTFAVVMSFLVGCSGASKKPVEETTQTSTAPVQQQVEAQLAHVVYFDFDQYALTAESRAVLLAHADKLKGASVAVRLEGHADERGSREYNMALGEKRANAVRDFLVTQGVSGSSLEVVSFGEEQPVALGHDESAWSQNRRVEIKY
ncbi:peptidoglycan-associated lipoprotein Pal [Cellvibrio japonicus]|uniref:Peptidoglycan-associated lipoprotein n=1 Tax=Cellvibrio japonicus (strain Ueda107) TaxID=498211 RepID=B3PB64_CELJU|nr:peptidoglycan-associated lipoprotein Pal [Cellvibrio japonicus]ACE85269.1 outer membrane protein [Cellvibrio japonicus Ueda107]QEI11654.1 peptidoglycan-associated lipoprotein Pal [Cellvibrio japonicus]QEI15228.1 peptidoglycan-associated lipoprotein Pal [Cellvibrio japonicus]QEI18808.1 peptidoglycan-associated lipoprotein Pal [Cellvibrio japonicus]